MTFQFVQKNLPQTQEFFKVQNTRSCLTQWQKNYLPLPKFH